MTQISTVEKPQRHPDCIFLPLTVSSFFPAFRHAQTRASYRSRRVSLSFCSFHDPRSVSKPGARDCSLPGPSVNKPSGSFRGYFSSPVDNLLCFTWSQSSWVGTSAKIRPCFSFPSSAAVTTRLDGESSSQSHLQMRFEGRALIERANWRPGCSRFHFLWYAPYFAFVLSQTWHFYWHDLKGSDKVNQHLHTLFRWC